MFGFVVGVVLFLTGLATLHTAPAGGFLLVVAGVLMGVLRAVEEAKGGVR